MPDLEASVQRASAGDREALQQLVVAHLADLERFIRRRTGDRFLGKESLEDLVQSAAHEALAHLSGLEYRGAAAFESWLYKIALAKIIARHRHYGRPARYTPRADGVRGALAIYARTSPPSDGEARSSRPALPRPRELSEAPQCSSCSGPELPLPGCAAVGRSEPTCRNLLCRRSLGGEC